MENQIRLSDSDGMAPNLQFLLLNANAFPGNIRLLIRKCIFFALGSTGKKYKIFNICMEH